MHYFFQMHYCYTLEYTYFRLESSRRPAEIWIWTACQMLLWQRILFEIFFVSFLGMPSANLLFLLYWRWDLLVLKVIQQWLRYSEAHWRIELDSIEFFFCLNHYLHALLWPFPLYVFQDLFVSSLIYLAFIINAPLDLCLFPSSAWIPI